MEQLLADNAQLAQQVALLSLQLAQMQVAAQVCPHWKCPVPVPEKFNGTLELFPGLGDNVSCL